MNNLTEYIFNQILFLSNFDSHKILWSLIQTLKLHITYLGMIKHRLNKLCKYTGLNPIQ